MRKKAELATIKAPRSRLERENAAWSSVDRPTAEQWLLGLMRHSQAEKIEAFLKEIDADELAPAGLGFVYWRAPRGLFDHDLAVSFQWWAWNNSLIRF